MYAMWETVGVGIRKMWLKYLDEAVFEYFEPMSYSPCNSDHMAHRICLR